MREQRSIQEIKDQILGLEHELRDIDLYLSRVEKHEKRREEIAGSCFSRGGGEITKLKQELAKAMHVEAQGSMKRIVWKKPPDYREKESVVIKRTAKRVYYNHVGDTVERYVAIEGGPSHDGIVDMEATFGKDN